jgi:chlorite dismutase
MDKECTILPMSDLAAARRQFVNFIFYKVDPAWRRLPQGDRDRGKQEFRQIVEEYHGRDHLLIVPYSTVGIRGDCDFMLWRIGFRLEPLQEMGAKLLATGLGSYLTTPYSYVSMTKRSIYIDHHVHEGQEGARTKIVPGKSKYLFVYPLVKMRPWYRMPFEERQRIMDEHIKTGHKYPSVKINTTYSFGLDDQEFVVAFEGDKPEDFLDLVQELRASESSAYTERETPIFTCVRRSIEETLDLLGG